MKMRFGRKLKLPSTVQIKQQILRSWLADQIDKEAVEFRKPKPGLPQFRPAGSLSVIEPGTESPVC